ncbi:carboxypeptidase regulatory-like domain-containing protein [Actinoplanes sp. NPDC049316]|uniref:carboxypeptidase regulatory-like domain-containing protein n=1 Tax=Actinoplanes sp. NPDC049316 TaxID=3154727 RepID=UPI00341ED6A1
MTRRIRWARAAALIALLGGALAVPAAPAAAAPPAIRIESVSSDTVKSGEPVRVRFRATNNERGAARVFVAVSGGLRCTDGCAAVRDLGPGRSETFKATVVAPQVRAGEETGLNLAVSVRVGVQTAFDHKQILVRGGDTPSSAVSRVSGRVRDAAGKAVRNADVTVRDSAGHSYRTTSGKDGKFSVRSSDSRPIAAGLITVGAGKDGYRTARATVQATAGGTATVRLVLAAVAVPSKTPPTPTAVTSSPEVAEEPAAQESPAEATPPASTATGGDEGGSVLPYTILGVLLVAAGVGALVLMLIRRRKSADEPDTLVEPVGGGMADAPTAVLHTVPPYGGTGRR